MFVCKYLVAGIFLFLNLKNSCVDKRSVAIKSNSETVSFHQSYSSQVPTNQYHQIVNISRTLCQIITTRCVYPFSSIPLTFLLHLLILVISDDKATEELCVCSIFLILLSFSLSTVRVFYEENLVPLLKILVLELKREDSFSLVSSWSVFIYTYIRFCSFIYCGSGEKFWAGCVMIKICYDLLFVIYYILLYFYTAHYSG